MANYQNIKNKIQEFLPEMIKIRHDIHENPELAYTETRTAKLVANLLTKYGYKVETGLGKTGLVGQLKIGNGDKKISLRADMDALPIFETADVEYKSKKEGLMHACGHDGHTTILLTTARYLAEARNFNGTVNLIFQPAEEGGAGAKAMIDDGLFKKYPTDLIYGLHNMPGGDLGSFNFRSGPAMASVDQAVITITGKGGHGAAPHTTIDPTVIASSIVLALQTIISRNVSPFEMAVITVGSLKAGTTFNVIPDSAILELSIRALDKKVQDLLEKRIKEIVNFQAQSFGAKAEVNYVRNYPITINHEKETNYAIEIAKNLFGEDKINSNMQQRSGSEDFSFFLQEVPGSYFFLGNGNSQFCHNANYIFNDEILLPGAIMFSALVEDYLK